MSSKWLATPTLSSASNVTGGVKFKWKAVTGAESYIVYRKTGSGSWSKIGTSTSTSYTDTSVKSGKSYSYSVRAVGTDPNGVTVKSGYNSTGKSVTAK